MSETVRLHVPEIDCVGCAAVIGATLKRLPGVEAVDGDADTKQVTVNYDATATDVAALQRALSNIGFEAEAPAATEDTP